MAEPTASTNPTPLRPPPPAPPGLPGPPTPPPPPPGRDIPPAPPSPPLPPPPVPPAASGAPTPGAGHRRHRRALSLAAVGLLALGATGGAAVVHSLDDGTDPVVAAQSSLDTPADPVAQTDADEPLAQAAAEVLPSVVSILTSNGQGQGEGSGVVISSDGLILTNNHVVAMAADGGDLEVTLPDGSTAAATIEGRDPASDLAVIRVEGQDDLTPATLGSSADLQVGETVMAVGSPLGLDGSVTAGIVSAVGRAITLGDDPTAPAAVVSAIQTDAAINPGNSGGALVNADGEVVGINTANASLAQTMGGQSGSIGLGFAIPIDEARDIADQLVDDGEATHAYLGVSSVDGEDGITLAEVRADGPAAGAGLEEGDVVTAVDDTRVTDVASFTAAIRAHDPGDEVTVHLTRDGDEQEVTVILGTLPSSTS